MNERAKERANEWAKKLMNEDLCQSDISGINHGNIIH